MVGISLPLNPRLLEAERNRPSLSKLNIIGRCSQYKTFAECLVSHLEQPDRHDVMSICLRPRMFCANPLNVVSRTIIGSFVEQMRMRVVPLFHDLKWGLALQG